MLESLQNGHTKFKVISICANSGKMRKNRIFYFTVKHQDLRSCQERRSQAQRLSWNFRQTGSNQVTEVSWKPWWECVQVQRAVNNDKSRRQRLPCWSLDLPLGESCVVVVRQEFVMERVDLCLLICVFLSTSEKWRWPSLWGWKLELFSVSFLCLFVYWLIDGTECELRALARSLSLEPQL
jgi:hypothetical protein